MYLCNCGGVTEKEFKDKRKEGLSIGRTCAILKIGRGCRQCLKQIHKLEEVLKNDCHDSK